jgi:hypothetical protein
MSTINPYLVIGTLISKGINCDQINAFVIAYVKSEIKSGLKHSDAVSKLKNFSIELNETILNSCVNFHYEEKKIEIDNKMVTVKEAATTLNFTTATIRNWINDESNPLPCERPSPRRTRVNLIVLMDYIKKNNIKLPNI